jgi:16S rRNA (cytosine1402-N4)-methyltransferase
MLAEVLQHLDPKPGETIVDCTLGYGGHAKAILERLTSEAPPRSGATHASRLIALDVDGAELAKTVERLSSISSVFRETLHAHRMRFAGLAKALALEKVEQVDGVFADLGVSSMQLDDPSRGFSVKRDGPLDLRMDDRLKRTAADLVNTLSEDELAAAFRDLADEPDAETIAREIVARRRTRPFSRTRELADAIAAANGTSSQSSAHATHRRTQPVFQALRMLVNDELANLRELLRVAPLVLAPNGRFVVVSFHSGEDALVERAFRSGLERGVYRSIAESPSRPSPEEVRANSRARSAMLRFAIR